MRGVWLAILLAVTPIPAGVVLRSQAAPNKPVRNTEMHADGGYLVSSISDLWKLAQVVAEVELGTPRQDEITASGQRLDLPVLSYDAVVRTILKGDGSVNDRTTALTISRIGGRIDRGEYIANYIDSRFPAFVPYRTYLLFLKRDDAGRYWAVTSDAESAYEIDREIVRPLSKSAFAQGLAKMSRSALLTALRTQGRR